MSARNLKSEIRSWDVIEIFDTDVPKKILKAFDKAQSGDEEGYVFKLMWGDAFIYHGEDGWVLDEETLGVAEKWLEKHRVHHNLGQSACFWFRIKRA